MGKKIANDINVISPQKNSLPRDIKLELQALDLMNMQNDSIRGNMPEPRSNDHKKSSDQENKASTNQAQDNEEVEAERQQTVVQEFELPPTHQNMNEEVRQDVEIELRDDNSSRTSKKKDTEYVKFFKHYYEKYNKQHPNWTPAQITTIISLLWKKKKATEKNLVPGAKSRMGTTRRSNRPLTAKEAFKMEHKELTKEEIDDVWVKLPQESKNFWKKKGESNCTGAKLSEVSSVDNCRVPLLVHNSAKSLLNMF